MLIVDDDALVRTSIVTYLRSRGLAVFEAASMQSGEARFRECSPDLAILDHCLLI